MNSLRLSIALACTALFAAPSLHAQQAQPTPPKLDALARGRAHDILHQTYNEVRNHYYDPTFHGVDLEARYHEYDARLDKVNTQGEGFRVIAGFLSGLHDSHLFFAPPPRPYRYDMGFRSQVIGDMVYVTHVRPPPTLPKNSAPAIASSTSTASMTTAVIITTSCTTSTPSPPPPTSTSISSRPAVSRNKSVSTARSLPAR